MRSKGGPQNVALSLWICGAVGEQQTFLLCGQGASRWWWWRLTEQRSRRGRPEAVAKQKKGIKGWTPIFPTGVCGFRHTKGVGHVLLGQAHSLAQPADSFSYGVVLVHGRIYTPIVYRLQGVELYEKFAQIHQQYTPGKRKNEKTIFFYLNWPKFSSKVFSTNEKTRQEKIKMMVPVHVSEETKKDLKVLAAKKGTKIQDEAEAAIQKHLVREWKKLGS